MLETVLVGPPVRWRVAPWTGDRRRLWLLADATASQMVGTGRLARTLREPRRFREVVLVPDDGAVVAAVERAATGDDGTVTMGSVVLSHRESGLDPDDASDAAWAEFAEWLTGIVVLAAQRDEIVVLEAGGWRFADEPFVLAFRATDHDGGVMHIERRPRPARPPAGRRPTRPRVGRALAVDLRSASCWD